MGQDNIRNQSLTIRPRMKDSQLGIREPPDTDPLRQGRQEVSLPHHRGGVKRYVVPFAFEDEQIGPVGIRFEDVCFAESAVAGAEIPIVIYEDDLRPGSPCCVCDFRVHVPDEFVIARAVRLIEEFLAAEERDADRVALRGVLVEELRIAGDVDTSGSWGELGACDLEESVQRHWKCSPYIRPRRLHRLLTWSSSKSEDARIYNGAKTDIIPARRDRHLLFPPLISKTCTVSWTIHSEKKKTSPHSVYPVIKPRDLLLQNISNRSTCASQVIEPPPHLILIS